MFNLRDNITRKGINKSESSSISDSIEIEIRTFSESEKPKRKIRGFKLRGNFEIRKELTKLILLIVFTYEATFNLKPTPRMFSIDMF